MPFKVTTWNINSVRLRIDLVARFLKSAQPDVLCLQETKCPDDAFPMKRFKRLGYEHAALNGQKGYHGVAVVSRVPFERIDVQNFCGKIDCRHISVVLGERADLKDQITLHNFYVPAGGDEPDPEINPKFQHKLGFLDEMRAHAGLKPEKSAARDPRGRPQCGAARARRLEPQADDQGGFAHAGRMRETCRRAEIRRLDRLHARAYARAGKALHVVELSRDGQLARGRSRPQARSRLDVGRARRPGIDDRHCQELSRRTSGRPTTCR